MIEKRPAKENKEKSPLEGKYVIANWQECDTDDEIRATFLYKIVQGKIEGVFGQLNLNPNPRDGDNIHDSETGLRYSYQQYFLELIKKLKIDELYIIEEFKRSEFGNMREEVLKEFGLDYGFIDYDDPDTDYGDEETVHNWGELNSMISNDVLNDLKEMGVQIKGYNLETEEVSEY